jgi:hypothetical protein
VIGFKEGVKGIGEKYIMRSFMICTLRQYDSGWQIKDIDTAWTRSMNGGEEKCMLDFSWKN